MIGMFRHKKLSVTPLLLSALVAVGCSSGSDDDPEAGGQPVVGSEAPVDNTGGTTEEVDTPVVDAPVDESPVDATPAPPVVASAFREIQDTVFSPICAECHGAAFPSAGLRLDDGASFAALVGVASAEVPSLNRIQPEDPDNSYLIQKIEGTAAVGARMPLGGPPLPQTTIDLIRQWVTDGALPETPSLAANSARVVSASVQADQILNNMPETISIVWSDEVDQPSFDSAAVTLVGSGGDSTFNDGNEVPVEMSLTASSSGFVTSFLTGLTNPNNDAYQLRISGSDDIRALAADAAAIDGDGDSIPGGDFVRNFTITSR